MRNLCLVEMRNRCRSQKKIDQSTRRAAQECLCVDSSAILECKRTINGYISFYLVLYINYKTEPTMVVDKYNSFFYSFGRKLVPYLYSTLT